MAVLRISGWVTFWTLRSKAALSMSALSMQRISQSVWDLGGVARRVDGPVPLSSLSSALIPEEMIEEERVVGEVAFEEAAGFHGEAVGPFEAEALEDGRGLFHLSGVEGEGGTDAEIDAGRKLVLVFCDPVFLFRAAEADPDQVGSGGADFFADAVEFIVRPLAEWAVSRCRR